MQSFLPDWYNPLVIGDLGIKHHRGQTGFHSTSCKTMMFSTSKASLDAVLKKSSFAPSSIYTIDERQFDGNIFFSSIYYLHSIFKQCTRDKESFDVNSENILSWLEDQWTPFDSLTLWLKPLYQRVLCLHISSLSSYIEQQLVDRTPGEGDEGILLLSRYSVYQYRYLYQPERSGTENDLQPKHGAKRTRLARRECDCWVDVSLRARTLRKIDQFIFPCFDEKRHLFGLGLPARLSALHWLLLCVGWEKLLQPRENNGAIYIFYTFLREY